MLSVVAPGQGSQYPRMLDPWLKSENSRLILNDISKEIGLDLSSVNNDFDAQGIQKTDISQPMIVSASMLSFLSLNLNKSQIQKIVFAGHSVGEFTASICTQVFTLLDGLKIVKARGDSMAKCSLTGAATGMSAVLGNNVKEILNIISKFNLFPANVNSDTQIVIAGEIHDLREFEIKNNLGLKIIPLNVSSAFHTKFMNSAMEEFSKNLNDYVFNIPVAKLLTNKNGEIISEPSLIKESLITQISSPVRWDLCQNKLKELNVTGILELAPGGTLSAIAKRQLPGIEIFAIKSSEDIQTAQQFIERHLTL